MHLSFQSINYMYFSATLSSSSFAAEEEQELR